ncbi:hypothetical protein V6N13_029519 [Hibiscus sabdariffa]
MLLLLYLMVFLALTDHSSAIYCVCKDGVSEQMLQKTLDYACGAGADCSPIAQNGPCYNPNTVKDHCNYAVNSYFQKKGQAQGTCDFSGTAAIASNPPPNLPSCSFPSIGSSPTPTTGTPTTLTTGTPLITPTMGTPTTPTTGTTTGIPSTTSTTGTNTGTSTGNTVFGDSTTPLGPSVTTTGITDPNHAVSLLASTTTNIIFTFAITLWILVGCSWI